MSIDFHQITPRSGGQAEAFEELCCQLAARSSRQLNDPSIAIRVAWLPKHLDPFGINCLLSPPSKIF